MDGKQNHSALRIAIDRGKCSGLGMCEVEAPGFFEVNDEGFSTLVRTPFEQDRKMMEAAVSGCPTSAISIEEDQ